MVQPVEMRMILIAGAGGTSMEDAAMALFRAGHVPVVSAWFPASLVAHASLDLASDETFDQISRPVAERLLARCDAVLRVGGPCDEADALVGLGRARGLRVFFSLQEALDG